MEIISPREGVHTASSSMTGEIESVVARSLARTSSVISFFSAAASASFPYHYHFPFCSPKMIRRKERKEGGWITEVGRWDCLSLPDIQPWCRHWLRSFKQ